MTLEKVQSIVVIGMSIVAAVGTCVILWSILDSRREAKRFTEGIR